MPFVRIDALRADAAKLDGLGRAVHDALVEAIGIPADDLFQVLASHDGTTGMFRYDQDYLGVHRDDGLVYIDITMRAGRTSDQKKALYARIAELAGKYAGTEPRNVFVTIHENQFADWSFGDGVGQYLERSQ
jgi:phenylpyruvate tautomerase PptA (4-oxalocrotonate tautomerase family)